MVEFSNNVYYFPYELDVRTCPKNASTSLKNFYYSVMWYKQKAKMLSIVKKWSEDPLHDIHYFRRGPRNWREQQVWNKASFADWPFRPNSTRMAVKRDPVDRFLSCVEYLQAMANKNSKIDDPLVWKVSSRPWDKFYRHLRNAIDDVEQGRVFDVHLLPQTKYMGHIDQYHYVYDISEMELMYKDIFGIVGLNWGDYKSENVHYHHNPSSKTSSDRLEELKEEGKSLGRTRTRHKRKVISDDLTERDRARIKKLYKIDYDNGWY